MTKQEQLKVAFKIILLDILDEYKAFDKDVVTASLDEFSNRLLKEVSIRTPLK